MAELDFSHKVQEIPQGAQLPRYERKIAVQGTSFPEFQGVAEEHAAATNWMSNVGSQIATHASNQIAAKMGTELGKNPQGDIGIPLTDFDKVMQKSYQTQAESTLSLQANQLIVKSNLELARAPRITPDMLKKTNDSVSKGLTAIFANAPSGVKENLQYQYANKQIAQTAELTHRMINEGREDQRRTIELASTTNAENAYTISLHGNNDAAERLIKQTEEANAAGVAARTIHPASAKANVDTVRKSYTAGRLQHEYEQAVKEGKGEEFLKNVANKKPSYIKDTDYVPSVNNLLSYVNTQNSLKSQNNALMQAQLNTSLAKQDFQTAYSQLNDIRDNSSQVEFERAQLNYVKALKAFQKTDGLNNITQESWGDPESFSRIPDKQKTQIFDRMVTGYIKTNETQGTPVNHDDAEVAVAASAGGTISGFVNTLKNKIHSGNPVDMESAGRQIHQLREMNASKAIVGLNDQDKAIIEKFDALRGSMPADEAARSAIELSNQTTEQQKMNREKWANFLNNSTKVKAGAYISPSDFALSQVDLKKDEFMNVGIANVYGQHILDKYSTFYQLLNGDQVKALKLTKEHVNENFGDTGVNGKRFKTMFPLETIVGHKDSSEIVPYIQRDVIKNLEGRFALLKKSYDEKKSDEYWEVVPTDFKKTTHFFGEDEYPAIQVKQHKAGKEKAYNVVLIGNSYNWDISLQGNEGFTFPFMQIAPFLHIATYTPDINGINREFNAHMIQNIDKELDHRSLKALTHGK